MPQVTANNNSAQNTQKGLSTSEWSFVAAGLCGLGAYSINSDKNKYVKLIADNAGHQNIPAWTRNITLAKVFVPGMLILGAISVLRGLYGKMFTND